MSTPPSWHARRSVQTTSRQSGGLGSYEHYQNPILIVLQMCTLPQQELTAPAAAPTTPTAKEALPLPTDPILLLPDPILPVPFPSPLVLPLPDLPPVTGCECEETMCIMSFPEGCHCQWNFKKTCYDKCGGVSPGINTCPALPVAPVPKPTPKPNPTPAVLPDKPKAPGCECEQMMCIQSFPDSCHCEYGIAKDCYDKCGGKSPGLNTCPPKDVFGAGLYGDGPVRRDAEPEPQRATVPIPVNIPRVVAGAVGDKACNYEERFCAQVWPQSCICANANKYNRYLKCGGAVPTYQVSIAVLPVACIATKNRSPAHLRLNPISQQRSRLLLARPPRPRALARHLSLCSTRYRSAAVAVEVNSRLALQALHVSTTRTAMHPVDLSAIALVSVWKRRCAADLQALSARSLGRPAWMTPGMTVARRQVVRTVEGCASILRHSELRRRGGDVDESGLPIFVRVIRLTCVSD